MSSQGKGAVDDGLGIPRGSNPATASRIYETDEAEVLGAVQQFRERHRRPPSITDVFRLIKNLGYDKTVAMDEIRPPVNPIPEALIRPEPAPKPLIYWPNSPTEFRYVT